MASRNLELLTAAARLLQPLLKELVFVGGWLYPYFVVHGSPDPLCAAEIVRIVASRRVAKPSDLSALVPQ